MNIRPYVPIFRNPKLSKSSRVQLFKPKSPRQIYNAFVTTGEIPHVKNGGLSMSLDYPVKCFGDLSDAVAFAENIQSTQSRIDAVAASDAAAAAAEKERLMAEAYARFKAAEASSTASSLSSD